MSRRTQQNTGFTCIHCRAAVRPLRDGSFRNHCPQCLWSLHVDEEPGDRAADCRAAMAPVGLRDKPGKGWQIVHECRRCGAVRANRVAAGRDQPDDVEALIRLMPPPPAR